MMNIEEQIKDPELEKKVMVTVPDDDKIQTPPDNAVSDTSLTPLIRYWFTYHAPTSEDVAKYKQIRDAGLALARVIDTNCPKSADTTTAIRKVREAVMTANAAIACLGK